MPGISCRIGKSTIHSSKLQEWRQSVKGKCRKNYVALYFSRGSRKVGFCRTLYRMRRNFRNLPKCLKNWGQSRYSGRRGVCRVPCPIFPVQSVRAGRGPGVRPDGASISAIVAVRRRQGQNRDFGPVPGASGLAGGFGLPCAARRSPISARNVSVSASPSFVRK